MKLKIEEPAQKEIGKWLFDVAKYVATVILVSSFLGEFERKWLVYGIGVLLVIIFLVIGVIILNKKK